MAYKSLSGASMVKRGFGQVEPNHLSARFTGEIYAQLPAKSDITLLEQGQFVKYNYAKGCVDFEGKGEWMLVYNEIKLYRDWETDEDFALVAEDYMARVYSPVGQHDDKVTTFGNPIAPANPDRGHYQLGMSYEREVLNIPELMNLDGTAEDGRAQVNSMVPRVFKTHEGDIFTTNTVNAEYASLNVGDLLKVGDDGYLTTGADEGSDTMIWQVVKKYTLPDLQPAVKVMRIK